MTVGGIPIPAHKLSSAQQIWLAQIEHDTSSKVILRQGLFSPDDYEGFLAENGEYEDVELCYVANCFPEKHLPEYPELVQQELKRLIADQEPCNWLYSCAYGHSIDEVLSWLAEYTHLLTNGWHLERNAKFFDV